MEAGGGGEAGGGEAGGGEGQGTSVVEGGSYPGQSDSHPIGVHVTVLNPLTILLECTEHDVAVPAEVS